MQSNQTINPAVIIPNKQEVKARLQKEHEEELQLNYSTFTSQVVEQLENNGYAEQIIPDDLVGSQLLGTFTSQLVNQGWSFAYSRGYDSTFLNVA